MTIEEITIANDTFALLSTDNFEIFESESVPAGNHIQKEVMEYMSGFLSSSLTFISCYFKTQ